MWLVLTFTVPDVLSALAFGAKVDRLLPNININAVKPAIILVEVLLIIFE